MKLVPFSTIKAAQACDVDAVNCICKHFEGYIASRCLIRYEDEWGRVRSYVDEDLRYLAEISLYSAIFKFAIREPPEGFQPG